MERVGQTIAKYQMIAEGDCIIVGVSGGPDSVALLHLLHQEAPKYASRLHVVHVNHLLRGKQADLEAQYVARWSEQLGIPCTILCRDIREMMTQQGLSLEAAGHQARFGCFGEVAQAIGATKLALGHHQGDRVESVLIHLIQGCGLDGLAALPPRDGWLIRPLAEVSKEEIVAYCQKEQLHYFLDASNQEPICLRNQVRLSLLPLLVHDYNPKIAESLLRLASLVQGDNDFIDEQADLAWQACGRVDPEGVILDLSSFLGCHLSLQRRLLRKGYEQVAPGLQNLSFGQVEAILAMASQEKGAKQLDLPHGVRVFKGYNELIFQQKTTNEARKNQGYAYNWPLNEPFYLAEKEQLFKMVFSADPIQGRDFYHVLIDGKNLAGSLTIRTRRPGDRLRPLGMTGEKKLKDFFIDRKLPSKERDHQPLVYNKEELIWIPGYTIAEPYKISEKTTRFCFLTCEKVSKTDFF